MEVTGNLLGPLKCHFWQYKVSHYLVKEVVSFELNIDFDFDSDLIMIAITRFDCN